MEGSDGEGLVWFVPTMVCGRGDGGLERKRGCPAVGHPLGL